MSNDMLVRLYDLPSPEAALARTREAGVIIRRPMAYEKVETLAWIDQVFGSGWASEADVSFSRTPITQFIATKDSKIIGFACFDVTSRSFFGPTGVSQSERGQGIGVALLLESLHALHQMGYAYGIIGSAGPTGFYEKTVGAVSIPNSSPGVYVDRLKSD